MKAVICTEWGPPEVLQLTDVQKPVPRRGDVCIRVVATAVTASDTLVRGFKFPRRYRVAAKIARAVGLLPRRLILGTVVAGVVESVGRAVRNFQPGDEVFGLSPWKAGAYAEYVCWSAKSPIALRPTNLSYEEAAALPYGGLLALPLMRKATVSAGKRLLVYGASGAIGTATVQLAKHVGAHVTGVCSTRNLALVESLGADAVMDYTNEDFTKSDQRYDVIIDAVGIRKSAAAMVHAADVLTPGGKCISIDHIRPWLKADDLKLIKRLAESGELKPVIDRSYPLSEIVAAHRYVDDGHKRGNVIVTVSA